MGNGLKRILKIHGQMKVGDVTWIWDYAKDEPRIKSEMTKDEIEASQRKQRDENKR